ncbi:MAG: hypothetical protein OEW48_06820 [Phycisphaerae bacterium]|nr:hypothetical protein [Phycisphaerae bacterium]
MAERPYIERTGLPVKSAGVFIFLILTLSVVNGTVRGSKNQDSPEMRKLPSPRNELDLEQIPFKIVHETFHTIGCILICANFI